jgi:hypothetical protein
MLSKKTVLPDKGNHMKVRHHLRLASVRRIAQVDKYAKLQNSFKVRDIEGF